MSFGRRQGGVYRRFHHRITAWLAMAAVALAALAPAVAQAVVSGSGNSDWVEVCSVSGMVWVKTDASDTRHDAGSPLADAGMKCPWCGLHGGVAGLPPQTEARHLLAAGPALLPGARNLPKVCAVWLGASARAPPFAS
jgi:hypothetical protein